MAWELALIGIILAVVVIILLIFAFLGKELHESFFLMGVILALFFVLSGLSIQERILEINNINTTNTDASGTKIVSIVNTDYQVVLYLIVILSFILVVGYFFGVINKFKEWWGKRGHS